MSRSEKSRSQNVRLSGAMARILGMAGKFADQVPFFIVSPKLAVNASATGHFCVPCDAQIVGAQFSTITQQTTAPGTLTIYKNAVSIGTKAVATADVAGTITSISVSAGGDINTTTSKDLLSNGDVISFGTANAGAAGEIAVVLVCVPR